MTVPATTRRAGPFTGNGVTTSFPFTFKVFEPEDIQFTTADADGLETLRVLDSDYSVTLNPDQDASPGGSVTYPISGTPLASGHTAAISGAVEYTQELDLPGGGSFSPTALENALDRTTMQVQQLVEEVGRSLTLPVTAADADTELPTPEAGKVIAWNSTATGLVNIDSSDLASVVVAGTAYTDVFNGTGAQTAFTLTSDPGGVNALDVAISGVSQVNGVDFTVSGTTLTFTSAPPSGTGNIAVRYVAALPVGTTNAQDVVFDPAGTGAVATTVQAKLRERRSLRDFGAAGDGVTNDRDAIRLAIAWAKLTGGMLEASTEDTYFVGGFANTTGENKFTIDFDGFYFEPNGCTFTCTANTDASLASSYKQLLFLIQDANDWYIGDMSVVASDVVRPVGSATGVCAVFVYNVAASTTLGNLGAIRGYKLMATLASNTADAALYRHSGLVVKRVSNELGYYTVNLADNVDGMRATIYSNDIVRSYFVYGVSGHDVTIHTKLHSFFNDILVKRYSRDTSNIRIFYTCDSCVVSQPTINIEHQNDTDNGTIADVDITLNVLKSNPANPTIAFQSFTDAGVLRTTTASITRDIRLRGSTNSTTPIQINSELSGEQQSRLDAYKGLLRNLIDYKRYIISDGLTGIAAIGSAATSMSMKINVSEYKNLPTWGILTVWSADNATSGGANYFSRTAWVFFTVNSNGSLSGVTTTTISTFTADPGAFSPALSVTAGGVGSFDLVVAVTGYTGANRYCRATLQILGAQI